MLYSYYQLHNSDFARLFPAEAPDVPSSRFFDPRSVFYRLLRPELVSSHSTPLCSDTFTGWMNDSDQNKAFFKYEIIKATNRLNNIVIPQFAQFLNGFEFIKAEKIGNSKVESVPIQQQQPQHQNFIQFYLQEKNNPASNFSKPEKVAEYLQSLELKSLMPEYFSGWERKWNDIPHELSQLIDFIKVKKKTKEAKFSNVSPQRKIAKTKKNEMHAYGINLRKLGMIYSLVTDPLLKRLLLTEMTARVCKQELQALLRGQRDHSFQNSQNERQIRVIAQTFRKAKEGFKSLAFFFLSNFY